MTLSQQTELDTPQLNYYVSLPIVQIYQYFRDYSAYDMLARNENGTSETRSWPSLRDYLGGVVGNILKTQQGENDQRMTEVLKTKPVYGPAFIPKLSEAEDFNYSRWYRQTKGLDIPASFDEARKNNQSVIKAAREIESITPDIYQKAKKALESGAEYKTIEKIFPHQDELIGMLDQFNYNPYVIGEFLMMNMFPPLKPMDSIQFTPDVVKKYVSIFMCHGVIPASRDKLQGMEKSGPQQIKSIEGTYFIFPTQGENALVETSVPLKEVNDVLARTHYFATYFKRSSEDPKVKTNELEKKIRDESNAALTNQVGALAQGFQEKTFAKYGLGGSLVNIVPTAPFREIVKSVPVPQGGGASHDTSSMTGTNGAVLDLQEVRGKFREKYSERGDAFYVNLWKLREAKYQGNEAVNYRQVISIAYDINFTDVPENERIAYDCNAQAFQNMFDEYAPSNLKDIQNFFSERKDDNTYKLYDSNGNVFSMGDGSTEKRHHLALLFLRSALDVNTQDKVPARHVALIAPTTLENVKEKYFPST